MMKEHELYLHGIAYYGEKGKVELKLNYREGEEYKTEIIKLVFPTKNRRPSLTDNEKRKLKELLPPKLHKIVDPKVEKEF